MTTSFSCGFGTALPSSSVLDLNAAALKLALFGRGATGTTQATSDRGNKALVWSGDAAISSSQSRFYGSSVAFDGTGDYINAGTSGDYVFGGDFRLSCWLKTPVFNNASGRVIAACFRETSPYDGWEWSVASSTGGLRLYLSNGSAVADVFGSTVITDNAWHFIEVGRNGGALFLSVDGAVQQVGSFSGNYAHNKLTIGANGIGGAQMTGYMQDFLVYSGIGPRTSNFNPPSSGYATINM